MTHVFVSYVQEDLEKVRRLVKALRDSGLNVWVDRDAILPGEDWRFAIRQAIRQGDHFICCFSSAYLRREVTYVNEEITIAIEELRLRPFDRSWFIPVRLDLCNIPERNIGAGDALSALQRVDLFDDWDDGVARILRAMKVSSSKKQSAVSTPQAVGELIFIRGNENKYWGFNITGCVDNERVCYLSQNEAKKVQISAGNHRIQARYSGHALKAITNSSWGDYKEISGQSEIIPINLKPNASIVIRCGFIGGVSGVFRTWRVFGFNELYIEAEEMRPSSA